MRSCWARSCWVSGVDFVVSGGLGFAGLVEALVWGCAGVAIDRATRINKNLRMSASGGLDLYCGSKLRFDLWRVPPPLGVFWA